MKRRELPNGGWTETDPPLHTSISLDQKVNLGNYESASIFMTISGVQMDTSEDEIEGMLDQSKIVFDKMKVRMREKVDQVREGFF